MHDETLRSTPDARPSPRATRAGDARPTTVVGLFPDLAIALAAADEVVGAVGEVATISLIASDGREHYLRQVLAAEPDADDLLNATDADARHVEALRRQLHPSARLSVSGLGALIVAGPLLERWRGYAADEDLGTIARSNDLIGVLDHVCVPKAEAEAYAEGLRQGSALVLVEAPRSACEAIVAALDRHAPFDIEKTLVRWLREGWMSFERLDQPLSRHTLDEEHRHDAALRTTRPSDAERPWHQRPTP